MRTPPAVQMPDGVHGYPTGYLSEVDIRLKKARRRPGEKSFSPVCPRPQTCRAAKSWLGVWRDGQRSSGHDLRRVIDSGLIEQPHRIVGLSIHAHGDGVSRFRRVAEDLLQASLPVGTQMELVDL